MKKLIILSALLIPVSLVISCNTEIIKLQGNPGMEETRNKKNSAILVSNWFSVPLVVIQKNGEVYLEGLQVVKRQDNYDMNDYIKLAYVNTEQGSQEKERIPMKLCIPEVTPDVLFCFKFSLDDRRFHLTIKNPDPSAFISYSISRFTKFRYRYIIVSRTTYNSFNINWANYKEVAQALNLQS